MWPKVDDRKCTALEEILQELSSVRRQTQPAAKVTGASRPKELLPALLSSPKRRSENHSAFKDQLREASQKRRQRPWLPAPHPKLQAPNVKIASPSEFNPVLVLNEPHPHPWDGARVDAPRRHYPLWGLGRYMHTELQDKPPWKDPSRSIRPLRWDPTKLK